MRRASASEIFRQRMIFSVASRFLLAGRKIQIKLAKPRPTFRQNFSGKRQTTVLNNFKNLYSMSATLLCAVYSAVENFFLPQKIFSRRPKIFPPPEDFLAAVNFFDEKKIPSRVRRVFMSIEIFSGDESEEVEAASAGNNVCRHDNRAGAAVRPADNNVCRHDRAAGSICHRRDNDDVSAAGHSGADAPILCGRGVRFRSRARANVCP